MIQIPRFEKRELAKIPVDITLNNKATILIKDHKSDNIIGFIQLDGVKKDNEYLADKIIEAIEEFITDPNEH